MEDLRIICEKQEDEGSVALREKFLDLIIGASKGNYSAIVDITMVRAHSSPPQSPPLLPSFEWFWTLYEVYFIYLL